MSEIAAAWYFVVVVVSFGGDNPPQQIGPFKTEAQCKEVARAMYKGPFGPRITPCWEAPLSPREPSRRD